MIKRANLLEREETSIVFEASLLEREEEVCKGRYFKKSGINRSRMRDLRMKAFNIWEEREGNL